LQYKLPFHSHLATMGDTFLTVCQL